MLAEKATKSVMNGFLVFENPLINVPISVHLIEDLYELPSSMFHVKDNGKIRRLEYCQEEVETEGFVPVERPDIFTAVQVSQPEWIRIDREMKKVLLGKEHKEIIIVSSHKLSELSRLVIDRKITKNRSFEINPQKTSKGYDKSSANLLASLFERLRIKKRFLLCLAPLDSLLRFAVLMPSGVLHTLLYEEEQRELIGSPEGELMPSYTKPIDHLISSLDSEFPQLSMQPIIERVNTYLESATKKRSKGLLTEPQGKIRGTKQKVKQ